MGANLSDALTVYEGAVDALERAIDQSFGALEQQDAEALPIAIGTQQEKATALQAVQQQLKNTSATLGHGSLRDAVAADADAATLQPRYTTVQQRLQTLQHKFVTQAEAISRAMTNNAELISLLTNSKPTGAYEESGHTSSTTRNTLSARA